MTSGGGEGEGLGGAAGGVEVGPLSRFGAWWLGGLFIALGFIGSMGALSVDTGKTMVAAAGAIVGVLLLAADAGARRRIGRVGWPLWAFGALWVYLLGVIVIRTGEGGAKAEMRRSSLPSALLGGAPGSIAEGRAVIAAKLNGLFVRLGLPRMDFGTGVGRMRGGGPGGDR